MFWQMENGSLIASNIESLLDREDVTLQELMDEDDILQECKAGNPKLIDFLTRAESMSQMVDYIINEPPDSEEKTRFKYPNISCELLTSDQNAILDALTNDEQLLNRLFNFISTDQSLNPLLASFFAKTVTSLINRKTEETFAFLKSKEEFLSAMLKHLETSAIMDLLLKLVTNVDNTELRVTVIKWLHEHNLVQNLISMISSGHSKEQINNACSLLCDVIKAGRVHQALLQEKTEPDPILDAIESTEMVSTLLKNMFELRSEAALVSGISVLQALLEYKRHSLSLNPPPPSDSNLADANSEMEGIPTCYAQNLFSRADTINPDQMTQLDVERLSKAVNQAHAAIVPYLEQFKSLLTDPPSKAPIRSTVGTIEKPCGTTRVEVAHLITALLSSGNEALESDIAKLGILQILLDLFFEYQYNSFLHSHVEQSISIVLTNSSKNKSPPGSGDSVAKESDKLTLSPLSENLLKTCRLIERLLDAYEPEPILVPKNIDSKADISESGGDAKDSEEGTAVTASTESAETDASSPKKEESSGQPEIEKPPEPSQQAQKPSIRKKPRPGYMGHIIKIFNNIVKNMNEELLKEHILTLEPEYQEKWSTFKENTLPEVNKRLNSPLIADSGQSGSFADDAFTKKKIIEYQMQQMTRSIVDQMQGLNEFSGQFTEHEESIHSRLDQLAKVNLNLNDGNIDESNRDMQDLFDQICTESIKNRLDHGNSSDEEEMWDDHRETLTFSTFKPNANSASSISETNNNKAHNMTSSATLTSPALNMNSVASSSTLKDSPPSGMSNKSDDDVKMDIDQNDQMPWANDEIISPQPLPMDTHSPWDSNSGECNWPPPSDPFSNDTTWADFSSFSGTQDLGCPSGGVAQPESDAPLAASTDEKVPETTTPIPASGAAVNTTTAPQSSETTVETKAD